MGITEPVTTDSVSAASGGTEMSIIIPTLNEAEVLGDTLTAVADGSAEIIVIDGGSDDDTVKVARQYTPRVFISPKGRGLQQDTGARRSRGRVLLFLHADTHLPRNYLVLVREVMADENIVFGAFRLKIHPPCLALNIIALMANIRSRFFSLPYGDQALFVRRSTYLRIGGFRDWPVMEDVDLVRRLNRQGGFRLARGAAHTSARRWQSEHFARATIRNWSLIIRYASGISPHKLARHYPDTR